MSIWDPLHPITVLSFAVAPLPSPCADAGTDGNAPPCACLRSNSSTSSGSTFSSGSHVASSMSTHFTRYSRPPPSATSRCPTTASATPYSSPASKSATRSSATHPDLTHSLSPPSLHSTRYSLLFPLPLPSRILPTSAHSY
ncbi:hypothetical protein B296_00040746, partial [Ensete ventricosum]